MKGKKKMPVSTLTQKGQTTIPKEIRKFLKLEPNDKIFYQLEGQKVIIKPLKGNILDLKGSVTSQKKPVDFQKLRADTKKRVARKIAEEDQ